MTRQKAPFGRAVALVDTVPENFASAFEFTRGSELVRMKVEIERLRGENERLVALAYRDGLTGLRNRRCFSERLNEEISRLKRNQKSALSVMCIDVNDFKRLNDTQGHSAGDAALIAIGGVIESLIRAEDIACRIGGDEFAVMLPDTLEDKALVVANRIRAHMHVFERMGLGARALAIGVASWLPGDDEVRLVSRADAAMYEDKHGRAALEVRSFTNAA
jgi:diguanylate cyclase (GGDEF)-like protein